MRPAAWGDAMREVRSYLIVAALRFVGWAVVLLGLGVAAALTLNPELGAWL